MANLKNGVRPFYFGVHEYVHIFDTLLNTTFSGISRFIGCG